MRQGLNTSKIILMSVCAAQMSITPSSVRANEDRLQLESPEAEIQLALTSLAALEGRITSASKLRESQSLGPQSLQAELAFSKATELFTQTEYLASVRELNNYLNLSQVPDADKYLQAQFMLGQAYEKIGFASRATRAYLRYISSFMTRSNQDWEQFTTVVRHIMPLAAKQAKISQKELRQVFSSMLNLNVPENQKAEIYYVSAAMANETGNPELAMEWYNRAQSTTKDNAISLRAAYFKALIAISSQKYEEAENVLKQSLIDSDKSNPELRDMAHLTLARIAVHRQKPNTALLYYKKIGTDSVVYDDALFELTYVLLDQGQTNDARLAAEQYLKKFPEGPSTFQLKTLLGYLYLRANALPEARTEIAGNDKSLNDLAQWMRQSYQKSVRLTQADVEELFIRTNGQVNQSPYVRDAYQLFNQISEAHRRLSDARSNIQNLLYTLGRTNISQYKPQWSHEAEQLGAISQDSLMIGSRLTGSIKQLVASKFSSLEQHALAASQKRRANLLARSAELSRNKTSWRFWSDLSALSNTIIKKYRSLKDLEAQLAAAKIFSRSQRNLNNPQIREHITELTAQIRKLEKSLSRSQEVLRSQKIVDLISQSPHRAAAQLHVQYAALLHEDIDIIKKHFDSMDKPADRFIAEDAIKAFSRWEYINKNVYETFAKFDHKMQDELEGLVAEIDRHIDQHDNLERKLANIRSDLERFMGANVQNLVSYYLREIDERQAKHEKWQADIAWLEFNDASDDKEKLSGQHEVEQQILKDNLRDLQQGVLYQWPR